LAVWHKKRGVATVEGNLLQGREKGPPDSNPISNRKKKNHASLDSPVRKKV